MTCDSSSFTSYFSLLKVGYLHLLTIEIILLSSVDKRRRSFHKWIIRLKKKRKKKNNEFGLLKRQHHKLQVKDEVSCDLIRKIFSIKK